MYTESVLLESRTARSGMSHRVEILDKVKALALSADGVHATTRDVADYFEVGESVVNNLLDRHRQELLSNGLRVLKGAELREFVNLKMRFTSGNANSYPQTQRHLAVYTRRTILNVAMLLRDSEIARRVRAYLLDVEESTRPTTSPVQTARYESLDRRVTNLEEVVSHLGPVLRDLGPMLGRMSLRLERMDRRLGEMDRRLERMDRHLGEMDRRLVNTERVVGAMSRRLAEFAPVREREDGSPGGR